MNIRNKNDIKVYNEMPTQINLVGQHRTYIFPAAVDGVPSMNLVDFADIEYAHSRGIVFSAGLLVFDETEQEEIYAELRLNDWKDKVWFEKDIEDAIKNPTVQSMQRIIDINSLFIIERIRGKVIHAVNHNRDISNKVVTIVNTRYKEITSGVMKSKITIRPADVANDADNKRVEELEKKVREMSELMAKMSANEPFAPVDSEVSIQGEDEVKSVDNQNKTAPAKKAAGRKTTSAAKK